jgi:hypothetical protein
VFASTVTRMHDPVFADIDLQLDIDGRRGRIFVKDYIDTTGEPLVNNVSGAEVRAQIVLPDGFEFADADIGSGTSRTGGPMPLALTKTYAQFANLHLGSHGVVRAA